MIDPHPLTHSISADVVVTLTICACTMHIHTCIPIGLMYLNICAVNCVGNRDDEFEDVYINSSEAGEEVFSKDGPAMAQSRSRMRPCDRNGV